MMGTQPHLQNDYDRTRPRSNVAGRNLYNQTVATTVKVYPSTVIYQLPPKPMSKEDKRRLDIKERSKPRHP